MSHHDPPRPATVFVEAKPWQSSTTIWLSVLSIVVPLLVYAIDNALALGIPDKAIPWLALFVFAVGTIRQRFETTQPIGKPGELIPVDGASIDGAVPELTNAQMLRIAEYLRDLGMRDDESDDPHLILPRALRAELEQT